MNSYQIGRFCISYEPGDRSEWDKEIDTNDDTVACVLAYRCAAIVRVGTKWPRNHWSQTAAESEYCMYTKWYLWMGETGLDECSQAGEYSAGPVL